MIWETLKPALIFPDAEASSYEDVFRQVGGALTGAGYTKSTYVEALVEREREYPTGLDVDGWGVAIPHTPRDCDRYRGIQGPGGVYPDGDGR